MDLSHYGVQKPVHNPKAYVRKHAWTRLLGEKKILGGSVNKGREKPVQPQ